MYIHIYIRECVAVHASTRRSSPHRYRPTERERERERERARAREGGETHRSWSRMFSPPPYATAQARPVLYVNLRACATADTTEAIRYTQHTPKTHPTSEDTTRTTTPGNI